MLNNTENITARLISWVFHPLFAPAYGFAIMFSMPVFFTLMIPPKAKWYILFMVFTTTAFLPGALVFMMRKIKLIGSLQAENREDRLWPYLIVTVFYYACLTLIRRLELPLVFERFMMAAIVGVVFATTVNFFWKISIHMMAAGGLLAIPLTFSIRWLSYMPSLVVVVILLGGLTGFARLQLGAHSPGQVLAGFLSGFVIFLMAFLL